MIPAPRAIHARYATACDLIGSRTLFELTRDLYNKFPDAPAVGTFSFFTPTLVLRDPQNIEVVMTGDFSTFNDRAIDVDGHVDKLADNVTFMNGIRWKLTRQKMTPLFTAAKLRNMYYIMDKSGRDFVDYLQRGPKKQAFDILSTYCSASIAASVFGIHTEKSTMDSPFLEMAQKAVKPTTSLNLKIALVTLFPKLMSILRIRLFGNFENFFIGAIKQVLRVREKQNTKTHDFAELCVELQRKGTLRDAATGYEIEPTDEVMAAQAFFFFIAGVEPSATSMFFALFELAKHPDILDKLHEEVDDVFERCNDNPTYEAVTDMKYLDMVLDESMRIHPAIGNVLRRCTKSGGVLPVGQIHVDKGTLIHIPVYALHRDPKYYPEPEKFLPERFSDEGKRNILNYTYMPFGDGHRMCLDQRGRKRRNALHGRMTRADCPFASLSVRGLLLSRFLRRGALLRSILTVTEVSAITQRTLFSLRTLKIQPSSVSLNNTRSMRFARLQVKTGLLYLLRHFTVKTRDAHTEMKFGKLPGQVRPLNIDLQFVPRAKA
ncbi:Cytochrome P450 6B5 [Eumeta japonica]|uniref:unspecific monooxygenase n=1 Tax=Eumeta variegata TaxID=151549 RepID=A0A4C1ZVH1_EUMVA|nr:Cytochrome P450 6B5 [Eumeta japonica]